MIVASRRVLTHQRGAASIVKIKNLIFETVDIHGHIATGHRRMSNHNEVSEGKIAGRLVGEGEEGRLLKSARRPSSGVRTER
jgi:hypothetical protein